MSKHLTVKWMIISLLLISAKMAKAAEPDYANDVTEVYEDSEMEIDFSEENLNEFQHCWCNGSFDECVASFQASEMQFEVNNVQGNGKFNGEVNSFNEVNNVHGSGTFNGEVTTCKYYNCSVLYTSDRLVCRQMNQQSVCNSGLSFKFMTISSCCEPTCIGLFWPDPSESLVVDQPDDLGECSDSCLCLSVTETSHSETSSTTRSRSTELSSLDRPTDQLNTKLGTGNALLVSTTSAGNITDIVDLTTKSNHKTSNNAENVTGQLLNAIDQNTETKMSTVIVLVVVAILLVVIVLAVFVFLNRNNMRRNANEQDIDNANGHLSRIQFLQGEQSCRIESNDEETDMMSLNCSQGNSDIVDSGSCSTQVKSVTRLPPRVTTACDRDTTLQGDPVVLNTDIFSARWRKHGNISDSSNNTQNSSCGEFESTYSSEVHANSNSDAAKNVVRIGSDTDDIANNGTTQNSFGRNKNIVVGGDEMASNKTINCHDSSVTFEGLTEPETAGTLEQERSDLSANTFTQDLDEDLESSQPLLSSLDLVEDLRVQSTSSELSQDLDEDLDSSQPLLSSHKT